MLLAALHTCDKVENPLWVCDLTQTLGGFWSQRHSIGLILMCVCVCVLGSWRWACTASWPQTTGSTRTTTTTTATIQWSSTSTMTSRWKWLCGSGCTRRASSDCTCASEDSSPGMTPLLFTGRAHCSRKWDRSGNSAPSAFKPSHPRVADMCVVLPGWIRSNVFIFLSRLWFGLEMSHLSHAKLGQRNVGLHRL